jgi:chromosome segregation ATPase
MQILNSLARYIYTRYLSDYDQRISALEKKMSDTDDLKTQLDAEAATIAQLQTEVATVGTKFAALDASLLQLQTAAAGNGAIAGLVAEATQNAQNLKAALLNLQTADGDRALTQPASTTDASATDTSAAAAAATTAAPAASPQAPSV